MSKIRLCLSIVLSLILGMSLFIAHVPMLPGRALLLVTQAAIKWQGRE